MLGGDGRTAKRISEARVVEVTVDNMVGIIAGVLLLLGAAYTISRGTTWWVFKRVERKRDPQKFWIAVTALIVSGILLLLFNALPAPRVGPY